MSKTDRRILKTRKAIFQAFLNLLNQKGYDKLTVQDIIQLADVGRSTFYAHYESKESLLEQLCQDLFHHFLLEREQVALEDYLAHLFQHFQENRDHITSLLLSHNDYFHRLLQKELEHDLYPMLESRFSAETLKLPPSYLKQLVANHFISSLTWWLSQRQPVSKEDLVRYYLQTLMI